MLRAITFRSRRKSLSAFYAHAYEPVCKFLRPMSLGKSMSK